MANTTNLLRSSPSAHSSPRCKASSPKRDEDCLPNNRSTVGSEKLRRLVDHARMTPLRHRSAGGKRGAGWVLLWVAPGGAPGGLRVGWLIAYYPHPPPEASPHPFRPRRQIHGEAGGAARVPPLLGLAELRCSQVPGCLAHVQGLAGHFQGADSKNWPFLLGFSKVALPRSRKV